jgi:hypothetical protein
LLYDVREAKKPTKIYIQLDDTPENEGFKHGSEARALVSAEA